MLYILFCIWPITELYPPVTLRDNLFRDCTWHEVRLKRGSRQNDSHGITVVTQRNSWKGNIFDADSILKKKKIYRAIILVLTLYQKIRTLTMVIP